MGISFDLTQSDIWTMLRPKIVEMRQQRLEGLLHVQPEGLRGEQQYIAALDWVLAESIPQPEREETDIYDP